MLSYACDVNYYADARFMFHPLTISFLLLKKSYTMGLPPLVQATSSSPIDATQW